MNRNRFTPWLAGVGAALFCVLVMNAPAIKLAWQGQRYDSTAMGLVDEDQAYYFSRVREVTDGYPLIGNSALKEHRNDVSPNGFVEDITGGLSFITGWSLSTTIAFTNVLFPFLILLMLFAWLRGLSGSTLLGVTGMLVIWDKLFGFTGLLRESSPKVTLLFPMLYLCIVFIPDIQTHWHRIARGVLIGVMMYTYHYHWTALICFEALVVLHAFFIEKKSFKEVFTEACWTWVPFVLLAFPYGIRLIGRGGDPVSVDMWRRFGVISTRMITAPTLQAKLATWTLALGIGQLSGWIKNKKTQTLFLLLCAGLIAVNSNIITGAEAEFEGHYGRFVQLFTYATIFVLIITFLKKQTVTWIFSAMIGMTTLSAFAAVPNIVVHAEESRAAWADYKLGELMTWLQKNLPSQSVVMAPESIVSLVPVHTDHYVWFSYGARSFHVADKELMDRYITQTLFFPDETDSVETGFFKVFGNGAGADNAKSRTWFNIVNLFQKPWTKTIADFIPNQENRHILEASVASPDRAIVERALQSYELDAVVTDKPLPVDVAERFSHITKIGTYDIYERKTTD